MRYLLFLLLFIPTANAADVNGYTAKYECRAGGPNCNVDVATLKTRACDQTIETATAWASINFSNDTLCLRAGDHSAKGRLDLDNWQGTSGNYKVLRCVDGAGAQASTPWSVAEASRCKVKAIGLYNNAYVLLSRTTSDGDGYSTTAGINLFSGSTINNIIMDEVLVEDYQHAGIYLQSNGSLSTNIRVQNSVIREMRIVNSSFENDCVKIESGSNHYIVNNEIYDCNKLTYFSPAEITGSVVENNDGYYTSNFRYDCSGNQSASGDCSGGEGICWDTKGYSTSAAPHQIIQNRCWGMRPGDGDIAGAFTEPGGGWCVSFSAYDDTTSGTDYYLYKNNICMDSDAGLWNYWNGDGITRNSVIGNIFYDLYDHGGQPLGSLDQGGIIWREMQTTEVYLNTFINVTPSISNYGDGSSNDIRCNVFMHSGADSFSSETSTQLDYNGYYNTTPISPGDTTYFNKTVTTKATYTGCTTLGCTATENTTGLSAGDYVRTSETPETDCTSATDKDCFMYKVLTVGASGSIQATHGPLTFSRKLRTGAEEKYIPYARIHSSAAEYQYCPNTTGNRTGIGISNQTGIW